MRGFILAGIRQRAGRSLALVAGILLAATGFTVLTGATTTSRLRVEGLVEGTGRPAYDLLIRPQGARSADEDAHRVVRANALSGQYGGITEDDLRAVTDIPGVEVAAPIAMIGYVNTQLYTDFDLTAAVDRGRDRQILRVDPTYLADQGLSSARGPASYLYVTTHPLLFTDRMGPSWTPADGYTYGGGVRPPKNGCNGWVTALEAEPDGSYLAICGQLRSTYGAGATDLDFADLTPLQLLPDGQFRSFNSTGTRALITLNWSMPLLLTAIDPVAEDRLVGLRGAVTSGAYPAPTDGTGADTRGNVTIPALAAARPAIEGALRADFSRVDLAALPVTRTIEELDDALNRAPAQPLGCDEHDATTAYQQAMATAIDEPRFAELDNLIRTGPVEYSTGPSGTLQPVAVPPDLRVYQDSNVRGSAVSWQVGDMSFRRTTLLTYSNKDNVPGVKLVGTYDSSRLTRFDNLTQVPLETYQQTSTVAADKRSADLLGGKDLSPDGNPAGYLLGPATMLTTIKAARDYLGGPPDLISAIRVRVAGVDHYSKVNAERVRLVAERIAAAGLDVDITFGASLMPQTVTLPAGGYGRPELTLTEGWVLKGVASTVERAVDRKSLVLFILVLVVCALFGANAVTAAVRARTTELAILACLGWPGRRIATAILGEVAALGLVAGLASLALAKPVGFFLGVQTSWSRALLAVPVALGLALLAGLAPAWRAARTPPADLLQPLRTSRTRGRRPRGVIGLGLSGLVQVPGRTLLGVGALTVGVAALTALAAVTFAFHGTIVGTALGDAVSFTARRVDIMAVLVTVLLAALAVADVLYLNIRDRAAELATLRATGWPDAALIRMVVAEGGGIGLLGGITGAGLGLLAAGLLVGTISGTLLAAAATAAAGGALVAMLAALAPALLIRRLPTAALLTEE